MRVLHFEPGADGVIVRSRTPEPEPLAASGLSSDGVRLWAEVRPWGRMEVLELAAGGHLGMHSGPDPAICQIVRGRGMVGRPDGDDVPFAAPGVLVFEPGADHSFHSIEEPVTLTITVVGGT
jgi:hypothetical protein